MHTPYRPRFQDMLRASRCTRHATHMPAATPDLQQTYVVREASREPLALVS